MSEYSLKLIVRGSNMARHQEAKRDQIKSQTRQKLLAAAAGEIAREGYDRANINHIAEKAGFSVGTVYNYFKSKRTLMLALIGEVARIHLDFIAEQVRLETDPRRRLVRFFEAGFAFVSTHLTQAQAIVNNLYGRDAQFRQEMYRAYLPMFELLEREIITPGIGRGDFRPVDPTTTAAILMNIYLGSASQVDEKGNPWLSAGQVADFVLNGLTQKA
jgi:AcrR family transcriptional regulator